MDWMGQRSESSPAGVLLMHTSLIVITEIRDYYCKIVVFVIIFSALIIYFLENSTR